MAPKVPFLRTKSAGERAAAAKEQEKKDKEAKKAREAAEKEAQRQLELAHPNARFAPTQVRYADPTFEHPPPLNYSLRARKKSIAIFWTLIVIDCIFVPIILYFALWYATDLSPNAVFSISTGALGSVSIIEYFLRFRRLWKKGSTCRVIGARRYYVRHGVSGISWEIGDQRLICWTA